MDMITDNISYSRFNQDIIGYCLFIVHCNLSR